MTRCSPAKSFILCAMFAVCLAAVMSASCQGDTKPPNAQTHERIENKNFRLSTSAFKEGEYIPKKHTGDGPDVSPPLKWTAPPQGTKSFALICDDPDAPVGNWVHWVAWGIKPGARELPEGVPQQHEAAGMKQGLNDFRKTGYNGPAPPPGKDHRYYFRLYALDAELDLPPTTTKKDLTLAMKGHILAEKSLMGKYRR